MEFTVTPLFTPEQREMIEARSGNPKSLTFPCEDTPKSVTHLRNAAPNTGHDLHLNGLSVLVDLVVSKRLRVILLYRYGKYLNVVSSASLMHCPSLVSEPIEEVNASFQYGISIMMNLRVMKKMCAELSTIRHLDAEIDDFVTNLEDTLEVNGVQKPQPIVVREFEYLRCTGTGTPVHFRRLYVSIDDRSNTLSMTGLSLIILEQFLRYSSGIIHHKLHLNGVFNPSCLIGGRHFSLVSALTKEQAEIIIKQRKGHKMEDWAIIYDALNRLCHSRKSGE